MKYADSSKFLISFKNICSNIFDIISDLYNLVFPSIQNCVYCDTTIKNGYVCDKCTALLKKDLASNTVNDVYSCYIYSEKVKKLIAKYKFNNGEYLFEYISDEIYKLIEKEKINADIITYVPLHKKRQRQRGFNQSKIIAKKLSILCDIEFESCLERLKMTKQQALLSAENRIKNVKNAFILKFNRNFIGKSVIIIDDIITTGSTIGECKHLLLKAGAKQVICISFATSKSQKVFSPKLLGEE